MNDEDKAPPVEPPRALTSSEYWGGVHEHKHVGHILPRPGLYFHDLELERVFRAHIPSMPGRSMLEVGCGSSLWLPYFARRFGLRVHGLDYSAPGIAAARELLDRNGVAGELIQGDLFACAALGEPQVDGVFSLGLVEHFPDTTAVLSALARFLRPGGLLFTWIPNTRGRVFSWSMRLNPHLAGHYRHLTLQELCSAHRACGLQVEEAVHTQFLDLTWIDLTRFSRRRQVWLSRLFRVLSLPLVLAGRCGLFLRSRHWCSGMIVVARRSNPAAVE